MLISAESAPGGESVNLVVVSNRVARGKPNEPMTGGLAAALLPVVEHSGAIWVGSSGRVRDGHQKEPFAEIEALGSGALATLDLPAAHYGGYYEGFAKSSRTHYGDAGLRSARLPDRGGPPEFPRLCRRRARPHHRRRRRELAVWPYPLRSVSDWYRCGKVRSVCREVGLTSRRIAA